MIFVFVILITLSLFGHSFGNQFPNLDDEVLFRINWPGYDTQKDLLDSPDHETLTLVSADQEQYKCIFPLNYGNVQDESSSYSGPGPLALLLPLLRKKACNYKFDAYWSYDVCHGDKIVQYHKAKEGVQYTRQMQFTLGRITTQQLSDLEEVALEEHASPPSAADIVETTVQGVSTPYYAIQYTDGTLCDLTGRPRISRVLHVCFHEGRNDVYSVKETYTCEYELIVLSSALCAHPLYRRRAVEQAGIECVPGAAGVTRPRALLLQDVASLRQRIMPNTQLTEEEFEGGALVFNVEGELVSSTAPTAAHTPAHTPAHAPAFPLHPSTSDPALVQAFLSGEHCLDGGEGWWLYEFCYGRHVSQYHVLPDGRRLTILLGTFQEDEHREWIKLHPSKAPGRQQMSHHYSGGAVCDVTGRPRHVEVRLKCKQRPLGATAALRGGSSSVSLWLSEPEPCSYVLGVESALICDLLHRADPNGLVQHHTQTEDAPALDAQDIPTTGLGANDAKIVRMDTDAIPTAGMDAGDDPALGLGTYDAPKVGFGAHDAPTASLGNSHQEKKSGTERVKDNTEGDNKNVKDAPKVGKGRSNEATEEGTKSSKTATEGGSKNWKDSPGVASKNIKNNKYVETANTGSKSAQDASESGGKFTEGDKKEIYNDGKTKKDNNDDGIVGESGASSRQHDSVNMNKFPKRDNKKQSETSAPADKRLRPDDEL